MEKNFHKINDVIIVRKLAEKTVTRTQKSLKRAYFKIAAASSSFIQSYWNVKERFTVNVVFEWKSWI